MGRAFYAEEEKGGLREFNWTKCSVASQTKKMRQTTLLSQLQVRGIDIGQSALSDLEGQNRKVSDKELVAIADVLDVSVEELFHPKMEESTGV